MTKTEGSANRFKVCVAGAPEFSRNTQLVHALRQAGCQVTVLTANFEDLEKGYGDRAWVQQRFDENALLIAEHERQVDAVIECDAFVLCPPCSRSLHVLLGIAAAGGAPTIVLLDAGKPELAYGRAVADKLLLSVEEVVAAVGELIAAIALVEIPTGGGVA